MLFKFHADIRRSEFNKKKVKTGLKKEATDEPLEIDFTNLDDLLGFAVAFCGLRVEEFWGLIPRELDAVIRIKTIKADNDRKERLRELSWHAATVINPHLKKQIRGEDLMPDVWAAAASTTLSERDAQIDWSEMDIFRNGKKDTN